MDIYILFNTYLFGTEAAKIVYVVSYFRGIAFNWIKTYIDDFIAHKLVEGRITIAARTTTQEIITSYEKFKTNIQQIFGDIEQ
jgi:hypothetical protein